MSDNAEASVERPTVTTVSNQSPPSPWDEERKAIHTRFRNALEKIHRGWDMEKRVSFEEKDLADLAAGINSPAFPGFQLAALINLLSDRGVKRASFDEVSARAQMIRHAIDFSTMDYGLLVEETEALVHIATKLARLTTSAHADERNEAWLDIAGYAVLAADGLWHRRKKDE